MRFEFKIAALAVACFVWFTIAALPARVGFRLLTPDSVSGFGISGTVWNGSAKIINVGGQQLRNTEWDLALSQLFLGRLGAQLKTRWNGGYAEGFGTVSVFGKITLENSQTSADLAAMQSLLSLPELGGQVSLQIQELEVVDNWPTRLVGSGEIRNLSSPMMGRGSAAVIGDISVVFDTSTETDTEAITGKISDIGGPIELTGTLLLTRPSNYSLKTRVKARSEAPDTLRRNLEFLGKPEADGTRIFQIAGSI